MRTAILIGASFIAEAINPEIFTGYSGGQETFVGALVLAMMIMDFVDFIRGCHGRS
jgi:hypothetical protein